MNNIKTKHIRLDQVADNFVYLDDNFVLLFPYTPFTSKLREIMNASQITNFYSEGTFIDKQHLDSDKNEMTQHSQSMIKQSEDSYALYDSLYASFKKIILPIITTQHFVYEELFNYVYIEMYQTIANEHSVFLAITEFGVEVGNHNSIDDITDIYIHYIFKNLLFNLSCLFANTTAYFTKINHKLEIAMTVILMDIGVLSLLHQLAEMQKPFNLNIRSALVASSIKKITENILTKSRAPSSASALVDAIQSMIINPKIELPAHIRDATHYLYVISSYLHQIIPLPQSKIITPLEALTLLLNNVEKAFPVKFVKILINILGYYPPGSYVELNNGSIGMAIKSQENNLRCPLVHLLYGPDHTIKDPSSIISTFSQEFNLSKVFDIQKSSELRIIRKEILTK